MLLLSSFNKVILSHTVAFLPNISLFVNTCCLYRRGRGTCLIGHIFPFILNFPWLPLNLMLCCFILLLPNFSFSSCRSAAICPIWYCSHICFPSTTQMFHCFSTQGRRNDIKSGGARFNGLNKVGDKVGILLTRVGYSMIFESFWNTNKWNMVFYVPHSPPNVLNSMSL